MEPHIGLPTQWGACFSSASALPCIPGWCSGLAPAFGPGRDPGDPGSNPTSGSRCMEAASPSACVSASLSLSVRSQICWKLLSLPVAAEFQQYYIQKACKDAQLVGVPVGSNLFQEPRSYALF
ncbi:unnamed protein product [Nyctereutes procyonoides]|uniref:(raccoon dog) hypothetical protein n=1 Tax=Nyctereutes procyonoides TaxID=34880 RepID=A0A811ZRT3_NYCPR|nr:unnamed protein product [Nyctereutes procyonoides]